MSAVLDSSALLAHILGEEGGDRVEDELLQRPYMSTINLSETVHKLTRLGRPRERIERIVRAYPVRAIDVDLDLALEAGFAIAVTGPFGLSMGDRICLMLAKRLGVPALTADKKWAEVASGLDVQVELIR